ncbi:unnamed protein product [Adineta steineri]|uniref:Uncharacterized protein n=4 Tax=Adineta steineri TaxID=433720 RepID=A0A815S099_9BILA|nr:unnamed protein product [Adineta steineri]CAF3655343.1 unnamed protein product [Adineta steineri]
MSSFLTNDDYLIISRLLSFFSSSYGSNGRLKLIQTLDNSMSICTSISSRIQYQLKCRHLISRLLSVAIQKQITTYHDGGLYFSMIFCTFLKQFRDLSIDSNKKLLLFEQCLNLIDQMIIPFETITFNSIHQLLAIVRAVICKSLVYNNSDLIREQLCLLSVKTFLENITLVNLSEQQLILTIEGLSVEETNLFDGLLYEISSISSSLCSKTTRSCLYFTISLAGDYTINDVDHIETEEQMFEWIHNIANRIAKQIIAYTQLHNGGLILCQKVIHPTIKVQLKQYGIDTIDRLSRQNTSHFCYLTGCQPIETLALDTLDERYFGTLTEIKQIEIGKKNFLQFFNQTRPFHTLLLCSNTEQALLELKECMNASHHILTNTVRTKQALYGGGCSESMQILFLKSQINNLAVRALFNTLRHVICAQNDYDYVIDRIHGHLWYLSDENQINETCACELYSTTDYFQQQWQNYVFSLDNNENQVEKLKDNNEFFIRQNYPKYLDNFHMRINAFKTAIETEVIERSIHQYDEIPSPRSSHTLTAIENYLYVFGGEHEPRIPIDNDVWQFNIADNHWKRLLVTRGDRPEPRCGHTAAAVEHKLYIFGGRTLVDMKDSTSDELYAYDVDLKEWEQYRKISDKEVWPEKRSYHSMVSSADQLYVFGGCCENIRLNNLWQYDTGNKQWRQLASPNSQELVERGGCALVYLNSALWVFGGFCGTELNDIASFDLVTQSWTYLKDAQISPRSVFAYGCLNGVMIGHGGEQDPSELGHAGAGEFADDVILIQPTKENGERVQTKHVEFEKPVGGKRGWHAGATIKNTFYVFGGNTSENERVNSLFAIEFH